METMNKDRTYTAQSFEHLRNLTGLSDALITEHLDLYAGYVKQVNSLVQELTETSASPRERAGSRTSTTAWSCTSSTSPT